MKNLLITSLAVAALATAGSAQQINVSLGGGWAVTPVSQSNFLQFSQNNPTNQGFISGGALADAGSSMSNWFTSGGGSVQGYTISGSTVSGNASRTAGVTEFYTNAAGNGQVQVSLTAQPVRPLARLRGAGYSGSVTATVAVTCPYFGWLTASASATAVPPPAFPFMTTLPVSASATASNQSAFSLNMNSGATASGTLPAGSAMQMYAGANATGTVTLN
tara:strand:+ start:7400 stop:8056 length:657 start_codon:yes stop_codon:yes gene_type:complete